MMHFSPDPPSQDTLDHLSLLQDEVLAQPSRARQYEYASRLWNNRKGNAVNAEYWNDIESRLALNHPRPGFCQYCEYNHQYQTEHFFPKKHFIDKTFSWGNYLLVCGFCNLIYKGDRFAVFHPERGENYVDLPITRGTYPIPLSDDSVMINPRNDDPSQYVILDFPQCLYRPVDGLSNRERHRANYTIDCLHWNKNADLVRHRQKAYEGYLQKLEEYSRTLSAQDFTMLQNSLSPAKRNIIVLHNAFEFERSRILNKIREDLLDDPFPNVWHNMKLQRSSYPQIEALFQAVPDALTW